MNTLYTATLVSPGYIVLKHIASPEERRMSLHMNTLYTAMLVSPGHIVLKHIAIPEERRMSLYMNTLYAATKVTKTTCTTQSIHDNRIPGL